MKSRSSYEIFLPKSAKRANPEAAGELPDHRQSSFRRWYEGVGRESFAQIPAFQEIGSLYAALYLTAGGIRTAVQAGERDEALRQASEMSRIEQDLLNKLGELSAAIRPKTELRKSRHE